MEDYHWYFVIALLLVSGVLLFVFIYTLNRNPEKEETPLNQGLVVTDVNVAANTISFYNDGIDIVNIYAIKEETTSQITMIENFNVTEANVIYEEPCLVLSTLEAGTYNVGYNTQRSGGQNIYSFTIY